MWWDKGYVQYESGNYEAAYNLFSKSYDSWKRYVTIRNEKNPYASMNHCLYKMGKEDLIDKYNAPYYYEELDTTDFYSAEIDKVVDEDEKPKGEVCKIIVADTYSRKSLEPILKSFFSNLNIEPYIVGEK